MTKLNNKFLNPCNKIFIFNKIFIYIPILFYIIIVCCCPRLSNELRTYENIVNEDRGNPVIGLFHGLGSGPECFDSLKQSLQKDFPNADVIALSSQKGSYTAFNSIKEQANASYTELLGQVSELKNRPMLLIGHSQGGLRAFKMYDAYKDLLNVKGLITLATPWEGSPGLDVDQESFLRRANDPVVLKEMETFSIEYSGDPNHIKNHFREIIESFQDTIQHEGVKNLQPGNYFLSEINKTLPTAGVPIFAIGANESDFRVFLANKSKHEFQRLRQLWTDVIFTKMDHVKNKDHDMVVPLYSQLASNIIPEESVNFQRLVLNGAIHDEMLTLPTNQKARNILKHPVAFKEIKKFAKKVLFKVSN